MNSSSASIPFNAAGASEEEVLSALGQGDRFALKHVYKECWPSVAGFVRQNNGQQTEAEELFQEAMVVLYQKSRDKRFRLTCSIKTYLYSICRNKWLNQLRNKPVTTSINELHHSLPDEELPEEKADEPLPEELADAVQKLGEPCQQLLLGYYFHQHSLERLAAQLNYASSNVAKQRKFRCLERLKKVFLHKENPASSR